MNNDYLWNKTGDDPEIERLEKALAPFRYHEAVRPLPAENEAAEIVAPARPWRFAWTAFAFAASLAAVTILWVGSLEISVEENGAAKSSDLVFVSRPETLMPNSPAEPEAPDTPKGAPPARRDPKKINPTTAFAPRRSRTKDAAARDTVAALSVEEKYAYRQLMLALSITGSKLQMVQDAIDGTEDTKDNASNNQR